MTEELESKIRSLETSHRICLAIIEDLKKRNRELLAENKELRDPIRHAQLQSKAMKAKTNNTKKYLKQLTRIVENGIDTGNI